MLKIELYDEYKFINKDQKKIIQKMLNYIFKSELIKGNYFFELTVVDNQKMQEINNTYRNKNYVTDVISFAFWDSNDSIKTELLGEIFLCKDKIISQALEYNHTVERELMFLISHGIYHLLGYDHQNENDEKEMMNKQYNVLEYLNIGSKNVKSK